MGRHARYKSPLKRKRQRSEANESKIERTIILLNLSQRKHFVFLVPWEVFKTCSGRDKLDCVGLANDLADVFRLQVLLADVSRLIVEEAMRVTHPGYSAEENSTTETDGKVRQPSFD